MGLTQGNIPNRTPAISGGGGSPVPTFQPGMGANFRAIPTYNPQGDNAMAQLFDGVSNTMMGIVHQVNSSLDQKAESQGYEAGRVAGADPSFNPNTLPKPGTIAGDAWRKGAVESYLAQLEIQRDEKFNQFVVDSNGDPVQLAAKLDGWISGTAKGLPDVMRVPFVELSKPKAIATVHAATLQYLKDQDASREKDQDAQLKIYKADAVRYALPQNKAEEAAQATAVGQAVALIRDRYHTPHEQEVQIRAFQSEVRAATLLEGFNQAPNGHETKGNKYEYFRDFVNEKPENLGLVDTEDETAIEQQNKLATIMQARLNDMDYASKALETQMSFEQELDLSIQKADFEKRVELGEPTEEDIIQYAKGNPKLKDDPEWAARQIVKLRQVKASADEFKSRQTELLQAFQHGDHIFVDFRDADAVAKWDKVYEQMLDNKASGGSGYLMPVQGTVTSGFSPARKNPVTGEVRPHTGMDIAVPLGTPVRAAKSGRVIFAGTQQGYGKHIEIQHADGEITTYSHLDSIGVKVGDRVSQGLSIGKSGATGNATGPHLHFEIKVGNQFVDPQRQALTNKAATPITPDEKLRLDTMFMQTVRYVPKRKLAEIRVGLRSTDVNEVVRAAKEVQFIADNNIHVADDFSSRDYALAAVINQKLDHGFSAEQAYKQALEETDPLNEGKNQRVEADFKARKLLDKPENTLEGALQWNISLPFIGKVYSGGGAIPVGQGLRARMEDDWETQFQQAWKETGGNEQAARGLALKRFKQRYDKSTATGREVWMAYPPEKFYGLGGDNQWIGKQLSRFVGENTLLSRPLKPEEIFLVSDRLTARQAATKHPTYLVQYVSPQDGQIHTMNKDGVPLRWAPDAKPEIQSRATAQKARQKKAMDEAAQRRKMALQPLSNPYKFNMIGK